MGSYEDKDVAVAGDVAGATDATDAAITPAPRLLVGAPASGGGKTTFTCGLMHALCKRGLSVAACKCGPDYIDPMFHSEVIGAHSRNLDLFFSGAEQVRRLVADGAAQNDITVIEGVMGYYDGIAVSDEASAWDVARTTDTPAVLVVDGRGRARSIAAEVMGFARFRPDSRIAGVVFNRVSAGLYPRLKELVEAETGVRAYGYLPVLDDCSLESRHLGLVTASEVADLREKLDRLAAAMEDSIDIDGLVELARTAPDLGRRDWWNVSGEAGSVDEADDAAINHPAGSNDPAAINYPGGTVRPRIAVARDDAFCFYYADTLRLLERLGAELVEFSPLADASLPAGVDGLYLGGGYPELHARELSENSSMRASIARAIEAGLPTVAECGGFLYLHDALEGDDGASYPQVGIVKAKAFKTNKLGRFGYIEMTARQAGLLADVGGTLRAHEFHYWESENPGDAFAAQKPQSRRGWECSVTTSALYAGFPHLYLPANPAAARRFVATCAARAQAEEPRAQAEGARR